MEGLDEGERAWRCAEGTIKALNRKLTRAAKGVMDLKLKGVREAFRRIDAEGEAIALGKKLERLRRRLEQESADECTDGLIGLASLESWPC